MEPKVLGDFVGEGAVYGDLCICKFVHGHLIQKIVTTYALFIGYRLGTAPLSNSWRTIIIWLYIALNRTPNIDCYWGGQYPRYRLIP